MIHQLLDIFSSKENEIKEWLRNHKKSLNDPLYASVDLRNAGFKIGPVDTNIYPAGWNNICPKSQRLAAEKFKQFFTRNYPEVKKLLILPEHHTRNTFYLTNILNLQSIIELAGFEVQIGNFNMENQEEILNLEASDGRIVTEHKVRRENDKLLIDGFDADAYILNNDLSGGIPEILKDLKKPLIPTPSGGWHTRIKSDHFHYYNVLASMFAEDFGFDPWLISAYFDNAVNIDFSNPESLYEVVEKTNKVLANIEKKYTQYGISQKPFVFIKNESGTYGMGITTAEKGEDILTFNRDERKKMSTGKDKVKITRVIIQEGIPTSEQMNSRIAEPVLYMIDSEVVGGFFRLHGERGERENLNMPGMTFTKMCLHDLSSYKNTYNPDIDIKDMVSVYNVIAELASIATGYELIGLQKQP